MVCDTGSHTENNISTNTVPVVNGNIYIMADDDAGKEIVDDYVLHRLRIAGYTYRNGPSENPTAAMRTMRRIGQQFETAYMNSEQLDMTTDINVTGPDQLVVEAVESISDSLFETDINWGRIVGFVVLASKIAVKAHVQNRPSVTDVVVHNAAALLRRDRFASWINAHGSWDGFVRHYDRRDNGNVAHEEFSWSAAATFGIATLAGAAAVVNFFMQKS